MCLVGSQWPLTTKSSSWHCNSPVNEVMSFCTYTVFFFFPFILQDCVQDIRIGVSYLVTGTGVLNRVDDTELVQHLTHDDDTHPDCRKTGCHGPEATVGHRQRPQHHQDQVHHRRLRTNRGHNQYTHIETNSIICVQFVSVISLTQHPSPPAFTSSRATHTEKKATILRMWSSRSLQRKTWTLERLSENLLDRTSNLSITRPHLLGINSTERRRREDRWTKRERGLGIDWRNTKSTFSWEEISHRELKNCFGFFTICTLSQWYTVNYNIFSKFSLIFQFTIIIIIIKHNLILYGC